MPHTKLLTQSQLSSQKYDFEISATRPNIVCSHLPSFKTRSCHKLAAIHGSCGIWAAL